MKTWYRCPYCGQKIFQYDPGTARCKGIYMKCKGRDCGKIFEVIIE
jgi:DNA-directed RNA polymerase subunit RPC12/RpoP